VRGFFNASSVTSMPRSGWDKRRIWLKLASKQRRHLDHNERSEYLKAQTNHTKAKSTHGVLLKDFDETHLKDHRPTGVNPILMDLNYLIFSVSN